MDINDFETEHAVELCIHAGKKKLSLMTSLEVILDAVVLLEPVTVDGKLVGFPADCSVDFIYADKSHAYLWENVIIKPVKYQHRIYHSVSIIGEGSLINRRSSFRVPIGREMYITTFSLSGPQKTKVLVKDISESGFSFISREHFDKSRAVRLAFSMDKQSRDLLFGAMIVRVQKVGTRPEKVYGCKFSESYKILPGLMMQLQQERQREKLNLNSSGNIRI